MHIWYSEDETGRGRNPPRPLLAVSNVTAHPSTASVPITVMVRSFAVLMCPLKDELMVAVIPTIANVAYF